VKEQLEKCLSARVRTYFEAEIGRPVVWEFLGLAETVVQWQQMGKVRKPGTLLAVDLSLS